MDYLTALDILHRALRPRSYVEIGCREGASLARTRCPSVAIDPNFRLRQAPPVPIRLFKMESDTFFSENDLTQIIGAPFDLAFIDGMHRAEFALRDFFNLEAHAHTGSVVVVDDFLPHDMAWTTRTRNSRAWTGDIYKLVPHLRRERPDLKIEVFDVEMKGLAVVHGLNPAYRIDEENLAVHEAHLSGDEAALPSVTAIRAALAPRPVEEFEPLVHELAASRALGPADTPQDAAAAYLDLLKRSLLNEIYLDDELRLLYLRACLEGTEVFDYSVYHDIRSARADAFADLEERRGLGQFPERDIHRSGFSHTMMGRRRLDSLHECLDRIRANNIPGDLMECGVWRGGGCILMAGYLKIHNDTGRQVIIADSFDGLPPSSHAEDQGLVLDKTAFPELAVSLDEVKSNFATYGLLGENLTFLRGWFKDTLKHTQSDQIALLRLDGDLYESTMDALRALYDRVAPGGIVVIDDWGAVAACRKAVEDFFADRGEPLPQTHKIDWTGVWFTKPGEPAMPAQRSFKTAFPTPLLKSYQRGVMGYRYRGVPCLKSPIDLAIYARAIWELKPKTVIEIGSKAGGSALWLADLLGSYGFDCTLTSIDLEPPELDDPRIRFVTGDVADIEQILSDTQLGDAPHPWFVSEDSAHTFATCYTALGVFDRHMEPGDLLAMEDGVLDELGLAPRYNGGPNRAITEYLAKHPCAYEIVTDYCDMFGTNATYAPNGYLRKI